MKHRWLYTPLGWLLGSLARLPFGMLYALSDMLFLICYHLVRYRRKVVSDNLTTSFPDMTPDHIKDIEKKFYHNFTDYIVETIKLAHISDKEILSRMTFDGIEHIDSLFGKGKSIVAYFSHTGNWEWTPSVTLWSTYSPHQSVEFCQVYRPLRNEWFDRYFLKLRSRFDPLSFPKKSVLRDLLRLKRDNTLSITGFMSDQKPSHGDPTRVLRFLNHPTAMITGTETLARKLGMAAVYWDMHKVSRGHYHIKVVPMTDNAADLAPMALTDMYAEMLERTIRRDPAIWLWTHKRWKHPVTMPVTDPHHEAKNDAQ